MRFFDSAIRMTLLVGSCLVLSSCEIFDSLSGANLPSQYVIASIPGDRQQNAPVSVRRTAASNLQTWTASTLFLCNSPGGCPTVDPTHIRGGVPALVTGTSAFGRGGSSPGIASNGDFYVMAFWGRRASNQAIDRIDWPDVRMFVSVSHDGSTWTPPVETHTSGNVHSNSQGIVRSAGISVAPIGSNGPWFAAYADDTNTINVVRLPVTNDGFVDTRLTPTPSTTIAGASTNFAPALSHLNGSLVLGWRVPGANGAIQLLTTSNGESWPDGSTSATAMVGGVAHTSQGASPFLHTSGNSLFLTTTSGSTQGASNIDLFTSTDGINFSPVQSFPALTPFFGPAAAGPAPTEFVVVQPLGTVNQTRVFTSQAPVRTLNFPRGPRLTVAGGPS